jgi:hypothetical protein
MRKIKYYLLFIICFAACNSNSVKIDKRDKTENEYYYFPENTNSTIEFYNFDRILFLPDSVMLNKDNFGHTLVSFKVNNSHKIVEVKIIRFTIKNIHNEIFCYNAIGGDTTNKILKYEPYVSNYIKNLKVKSLKKGNNQEKIFGFYLLLCIYPESKKIEILQKQKVDSTEFCP